MADDDIWKNYETISDKMEVEIFDMPWYKDLAELCKKGGNIEEFIVEKDKKLYRSFLATDEILSINKKNRTEYIEKKRVNDENLNKSKAHFDKISSLPDKIQDVIATFPAHKRGDIERLMRDFATTGNFDERKIEAIKKKGNFWDRIKNGSKYKKGATKLEELMAECRECKDNVNTEPFKSYFKKVCNLENTAKNQEDCKKSIETSQEQSTLYQQQIEKTEKRIENRAKEYTVPEIENNKIRDFFAKNETYLQSPPQMTSEEIKQTGLTEDYIKGMMLNSKYPREVFRSCRRFYEELKEPAAPRVAYNSPASRKKLNPQEMVDKLREKGIDAVLSTDDRATDTKAFVVDEYNIHAPFLAPEDALKANIMMVEAIHDLGGRAALSNPMMRESMVHAVERKPQDTNNQFTKLEYDAEKQSNFVQDTLKEWDEKQSFSKHFDQIMKDIQTKDAELYKELYATVVKNISKYTTIDKDGFAEISPENENLLVKEVLLSNPKALEPYLCTEIQKEMFNEAIPNAISPNEFDAKVKQEIAQNGHPSSVFHAGKQGPNPFAVLCGEKEGNMCFVYGAAGVTSGEVAGVDGDGCFSYAFGNSSHNKREYKIGNTEFGFIYEYEARKEKQEMLGIDMAADFDGGKFNKEKMRGNRDETVILPHQNKLKKIYVAFREPGGKNHGMIPLELDEKGQIRDKKWRDFMELHAPKDDNISGKMIERRNNMLNEYDAQGKDNMYNKLEILQNKTPEIDKTNTTSNTSAEKPLKDKEYYRQLILEKTGVAPKQPQPTNQPHTPKQEINLAQIKAQQLSK